MIWENKPLASAQFLQLSSLLSHGLTKYIFAKYKMLNPKLHDIVEDVKNS
jgi:hypothetical protein